MNKPDQDPNKQTAENVYKPSTFLTLRRKAQPKDHTNPVPSESQIKSTKSNEPSQRTRSEDVKRKFTPNPKGAIVRDRSYDPSKDAMDEEDASKKKKESLIKKGNLLISSKEKPQASGSRGFLEKKINVSTARTAFGGGKSGNISNYQKTSKTKVDLFGTNLADEDLYKNKNFLFPVEVKIKTEPEEAKDAIKDSADKLAHDAIIEKNMMDTLLNEFSFFQLPANLPLEGCYQLTPKTEDSDIEINTDNLLSSFLNNRFDSTGFYLERDFKCLIDKHKNKMDEEKGKESRDKDKIPQEKLHDTFHIGKLCRMKNGEIKMKIGNNFFDVTEGVQDSFYKELYAIDYQEKVAMSLFPIEKKFVIKPDMNSFH